MKYKGSYYFKLIIISICKINHAIHLRFEVTKQAYINILCWAENRVFKMRHLDDEEPVPMDEDEFELFENRIKKNQYKCLIVKREVPDPESRKRQPYYFTLKVMPDQGQEVMLQNKGTDESFDYVKVHEDWLLVLLIISNQINFSSTKLLFMRIVAIIS